eukprot:98448-Prymnesium_polylepis.2
MDRNVETESSVACANLGKTDSDVLRFIILNSPASQEQTSSNSAFAAGEFSNVHIRVTLKQPPQWVRFGGCEEHKRSKRLGGHWGVLGSPERARSKVGVPFVTLTLYVRQPPNM